MSPKWSNRAIDAAVLVVAAVEGVLNTIAEETTAGMIPVVIAVLALLVRDRWPLPSFLATLPAVLFPGAVVPAVTAAMGVVTVAVVAAAVAPAAAVAVAVVRALPASDASA